MPTYESMIDSTNFGSVARYLNDPRSPIQYVLHVKHEAMLAEVAAKLDAAMAVVQEQPGAVPAIIDPMLADATLRVSSRHNVQFHDPAHQIVASSIPTLAPCRVIYLPPFYLAYTPGLFEGTLIQPEPRLRQAPAQRMRM